MNNRLLSLGIILIVITLAGCNSQDPSIDPEEENKYLMTVWYIVPDQVQFNSVPLEVSFLINTNTVICSTFYKVEFKAIGDTVDVWVWGTFSPLVACDTVDASNESISITIQPPLAIGDLIVRVHQPDESLLQQKFEIRPIPEDPNWQHYPIGTDDTESGRVDAVVADHLGNIWGTINNGSLFNISSGDVSMHPELMNEEIAFRGSRALAIGSNNSLWVGAFYGPYFANYSGSDWSIYRPETDVQDIHTLQLGLADTLWAASHYGRLLAFADGGITEIQLATRSTDAAKGGSVLHEPSGRLWFAREYSYFGYIENGEWTIFDFGRYFTDDDAFYLDDLGNFWFGHSSGVRKFDGTVWTDYLADDLLGNVADGHISAIEGDSRGDIWLGTNVGLYRFDGSVTERFTYENSGLADNDILALTIDILDQVWVGTALGVSMFLNPAP